MGRNMRIGEKKFTVDSRQYIGEKKFTVDSRQFTVENASQRCAATSADSQLSTVNCQLSTPPGFTLLELMIVMTLILILASIVTPTYHLAIVRAREAVLRDDLYTLRTLVDQYTTDKQQPPQTLQDLVEAGYLRAGLPVDPFTQSADTWRVDIEEVPLNPQQGASGIVDVHSGSDEISSDGTTAYSSW